MCTGGSIENILDNIGASCESLSSLIPQEKRTVSCAVQTVIYGSLIFKQEFFMTASIASIT